MENGDRLAAVKRRYLVVAVACVLGAALALFLAGRQHRQYAASSEVAVNQQSLPASSAFASAQQLQRQVETLANVAAGPAVAKLVLVRVPGTGGRRTTAGALECGAVGQRRSAHDPRLGRKPRSGRRACHGVRPGVRRLREPAHR